MQLYVISKYKRVWYLIEIWLEYILHVEYLLTELVYKLEIHILPSVEHLSSCGVVRKNSGHIPGAGDLGYWGVNFYLLPSGKRGRTFYCRCLSTENVKLLEYKGVC